MEHRFRIGAAVLAAAGLAAADMSEKEEIQLGQSAAPSIEYQMGGELADPALAGYFASVCRKVVAQGDRPGLPWTFRVLNTSDVNAFALPGGPTYITRGLLVRLRSEHQMAAVMGHETAHVARRHGVKQMDRASGFENLLKVVELAGAATGHEKETRIAGQVGGTALGLALNGYGREQEEEADKLGALYAAKSGYDPRGMAGTLSILLSIEKESDAPRMPAFLSDHPRTKDRIKTVNRYIARNWPAVEADYQAGKFVTREAEFNAAVAGLRGVHASYLVYDRAVAALDRGDVRAAAAGAAEALAKHPQQAPFLVLRGRVRIETGDTRGAAADFAEAARIDPACVDARLATGILLVGAGRPAEAEEHLTWVVARLPDLPEAQFYLAEAYLGQRKTGQARHHYRAVLDLTDQPPWAGRARDRLLEIGN